MITISTLETRTNVIVNIFIFPLRVQVNEVRLYLLLVQEVSLGSFRVQTVFTT